MNALRALVTFAGLIVRWQIVVAVTGLPHYLLPSPWLVANTLYSRADVLLENARFTAIEIVVGLILGVAFGALCALSLMASRLARRLLLPVMLASQAIPPSRSRRFWCCGSATAWPRKSS